MVPVAPESALVFLAPEAESLVGSFRMQYDPAARLGVPAHITLLYPFIPPGQIDPGVWKSLRQICRAQPAFDYVLAEIRAFPGVLYLAPKPDAPFRQLMGAICDRFPAYPPYGGAITDPIPHLTVGQTPDPETFGRLRESFSVQARGRLPIQERAVEVVVLESSSGRWRFQAAVALGD